jgi:hypothetical protein
MGYFEASDRLVVERRLGERKGSRRRTLRWGQKLRTCLLFSTEAIARDGEAAYLGLTGR